MARIMAGMQTPPQQILWPPPPPGWSPNWQAGSGVHVWAAALHLPGTDLTPFSLILSPPEMDRARRFHFERDRNHFIVARGFMRVILARYLGAKPDKLEFTYSTRGKPTLGGSYASVGLHFNLSHSGGIALLAVSPAGTVGIDVEQLRPMDDADQLVHRFFSSRETEAFQKMPPSAKSLAFFNLWTRKEAFLKASGEGIAHLLNQVEVSFLPGEPAKLLNLPEHCGNISDWQMYNLSPALGFVAALVAPVKTADPVCWRWTSESGFGL
jgi:4'-phosphopantetheinyl transferase